MKPLMRRMLLNALMCWHHCSKFRGSAVPAWSFSSLVVKKWSAFSVQHVCWIFFCQLLSVGHHDFEAKPTPWPMNMIVRRWMKKEKETDLFDSVKLGVQTEMSGPKSCEALASTCRLRCSLAGCLEFWRSGRSRSVRNRAEKKLKEDESEFKEK